MTKQTQGLSTSLTVLMSVATGLVVASNYYAQPLLDTIAHAFAITANQAGFIVTAAQLGYAFGLLFLVPLGDMFERRSMIVVMTLLAAAGMLITASSHTLAMMILGTALTGLFSVVAQILVPLAATLAAPEKRGKVVGTIMSGLLLGILLARTVSGALANLGGWRTVYWVATVLMVIMALALWRGLPAVKQTSTLNYPQLLGSIFSLFTRDKLLRTRALLGCLTFANFSILWTSMAFLLAGAPFHFSDGVIGLFGLAGAAGALGARPAGGLVDKGKAHLTTTWGLVLLLLLQYLPPNLTRTTARRAQRREKRYRRADQNKYKQRIQACCAIQRRRHRRRHDRQRANKSENSRNNPHDFTITQLNPGCSQRRCLTAY